MHRILVADSDHINLESIECLLGRAGYDVLTAHSAQAVLQAVETEPPDLFILNTVLPGMNGTMLCPRLRAHPHTRDIPIICLGGPDSPFGVAEALDLGADDYIRKPFAPLELLARVRAHLRRCATSIDHELPTLRLIDSTHSVDINGRRVSLTRVEYDLLRYLCYSPDKLHSIADLLVGVWQYPQGAGDAALVRNHIRNLRRKLEANPDRPLIIQSRHGRGYVVKANVVTTNRTALRPA